MYQNGFLDDLLNTPVLLEHLSGPQLEEDEHIQAVQEGRYAYEMQKSGLVFFRLDAYDEIGIKGAFTDRAGQKDSRSRFIPWSAVLSIS